MYLHLGQNTIVRKDSIVGIFDLDATTISVKTRNFLRDAEIRGEVENVSYELPKSFIVCVENGKHKVYISQISSSSLLKRASESRFV
ncbi:MAG: extracellular matrix regulator RemB [Acutalibacteraceae bacterium]